MHKNNKPFQIVSNTYSTDKIKNLKYKERPINENFYRLMKNSPSSFAQKHAKVKFIVSTMHHANKILRQTI